MSGTFIFLLLCYFVPTFIALSRGHHNPGPLIAVNVLLGWTILGWIVAFAMSLSLESKPVVINQIAEKPEEPKESHLDIAKRHLENVLEACREVSEQSLTILFVAAQSDGKIGRDDVRIIANFFVKQGADIKPAWLESIKELNAGITINLHGDKNCDEEIESIKLHNHAFKTALFGTFTALTIGNKRQSKSIDRLSQQLESLLLESAAVPSPTAESKTQPQVETISVVSTKSELPKKPEPLLKPQSEPQPDPPVLSWVEQAKAEMAEERRRKTIS